MLANSHRISIISRSSALNVEQLLEFLFFLFRILFKPFQVARVLGTSHNLSWGGGGGGEIVFYPKQQLFPDPYSIAPMFLGPPPRFNDVKGFKGLPFLHNTQMVRRMKKQKGKNKTKKRKVLLS